MGQLTFIIHADGAWSLSVEQEPQSMFPIRSVVCISGKGQKTLWLPPGWSSLLLDNKVLLRRLLISGHHNSRHPFENMNTSASPLPWHQQHHGDVAVIIRDDTGSVPKPGNGTRGCHSWSLTSAPVIPPSWALSKEVKRHSGIRKKRREGPMQKMLWEWECSLDIV